ncbi:phosphatase PAP2 family protein [Actinoplanes awajinensis]|uniref:Phosphoesterase PA-phosphatase n=1 Tax=Actinoplanes awajinensis subsp. mycoplanecinus TaxID=135947 RepID=A0A0X3V092_9ACTN|nr:phosphatase PAP2 family protein [Actinoplanes awajinensis]KUL37582.1 phosphoesterase PA-phosphatase [Actinoplanes awajinensis subsp. mycoplanecinus]
MSTFVVQAFKRIVLPVAAILVLMIGLGLLLTHVLPHTWPFTVEDGVNRSFEAGRTHVRTQISAVFSGVGNTSSVIAMTALMALVFRLTLHRWRESIFLCLAVTAQALVFFFTTLAIDRPRPDVERLDPSPPTSSFPSGHTSASFALYVGLAIVLASLGRPSWLKALCWLLVLMPVAVATARMYRGMHHPSDVISAFLNASLCLLVMSRAVLSPREPWKISKVSSWSPSTSRANRHPTGTATS